MIAISRTNCEVLKNGNSVMFRSGKFILAATTAIAGSAFAETAFAQVQRSVDNSSFEENDPPGDNAASVYANADVPGWSSESGRVEIWDSGHSGVPSAEGTKHAEINASAPGDLYQEVCLQNGELLTWKFFHRARNRGPSPQTVNFEITDLSGNPVQLLDTSIQTDTTQWFLSQNTAGVPFTGATGVYRMQFATSDLGSLGNFLDGVELGIIPFVQFKGRTSSELESVAGVESAKILVSGQFLSDSSVRINVTGGTATIGSDFTTPSGTNSFNVMIPAGDYVNEEFDSGLMVILDGDPEPDETIEMEISQNALDYVVASTSTCGGSGNANATHTITHLNADLSITKTNTPSINGDVDQASDTVTSGDTVPYALVVTNNGPDSVTGALVTDNPMSGLSCPATNAVTISGGGVPAGSFTVGELTGPGITLGTLANGDAATITFSCTVN